MADGTPAPAFPPADDPAAPAAGPAAGAASPRPFEPAPAKKPWALLAGGTFALIAAGVAATQLIDSEPAVAAPAPERAAPQAASPRGKVLATLSDGRNDMKITYDMVAAEAMNRYGVEVLEALINRGTVKMACDARGVAVSGAEIDAEITSAAKRYEVDRSTWLQMLQAERGLTPNQYAHDVIWPKLALQKLADENVTVTQEDVRKAFMRTYGPKVKARMIMFANFRRAQEVYAQAAKNPEDFGRLARQYSVDDTSKALDGVIPPIAMYGSPGTAELEKKAFALKDGEMSGVIQLPFPGMNRYVILKREGLTEPAATKLEDVRPLIEEELREQKVQESVAKVFTEIRDRTKVTNLLTQQVTEAKTPATATATR